MPAPFSLLLCTTTYLWTVVVSYILNLQALPVPCTRRTKACKADPSQTSKHRYTRLDRVAPHTTVQLMQANIGTTYQPSY